MFNLFRPRPGLIVHSQHPYNAEPPLDRLRASAVTAQGDFYVRSHGAIPSLDGGTHRLRVEGRVATPLDLSMTELRARFPQRTVVATMQCAGNRRADLHAVRPVSGEAWAPGAIGTAAWTGVALVDVLRAAGAADGSGGGALHVAFAAADEVELEGEAPFRYAVSIPLARALSPEVLLAFEMNGEALAPEHGFPLRVVVPGFAGVRSPKWLCAITVQDAPSNSALQQRDYRMMPPDATAETVDWARGVPIEEMPLTSAICEPARHARLAAGHTVLRGYAMASGRAVVRVDVSGDGGRSWGQAALQHDAEAPWSWTFWEHALELGAGEHELVVRAWDSAGQTQPARADEVWNFKGYLGAAWHRVAVSAG